MRCFLSLLLITLTLTACTRDRPQPEPIITVQPPDAPVTGPATTPVTDAADSSSETAADAQSGDTATGQEPEVATATPVPPQSATPTQATTAAGNTSTGNIAGADATTSDSSVFQYSVQEGDTISSIAEKFGTSVDVIQRLNFLVDDNIRTGQILRVAPGDGFTGAASTSSSDSAASSAPQNYTYTVQSGDNLLAIARRFGVELAALIEVNNLANPDDVAVGQQLIIPSDQAGTAPATNTSSSGGSGPAAHIVKRGETLFLISQKYGVDAAEIAAANNIQNRNILRVGQQLFIPGLTAEEAALANQIIHVVQPGEGLGSIALRYGVTTQEIAALNGITNIDVIQPGQELRIPQE